MTTKILLIAIVIILFFSGLTYYQYRQIQELKTQRHELIAIANDSARQATIYRDKLGREYSRNKVLSIQRDNARKLLESEEFEWTKKFDGLKKNIKNLTQTTRIDAKIDTTVRVLPPPVRIGGDFLPENCPSWPTIDQVLFEDQYVKVAIDSGGVNLALHIEVPIEGVIYWERSHKFWFIRWGKKRYISEFTSPNKMVEITNHEIIQVRRK